jgi:hypothetical protein
VGVLSALLQHSLIGLLCAVGKMNIRTNKVNKLAKNYFIKCECAIRIDISVLLGQAVLNSDTVGVRNNSKCSDIHEEIKT